MLYFVETRRPPTNMYERMLMAILVPPQLLCVFVCVGVGAGPVFAHAVEQAGHDFGGGVLRTEVQGIIVGIRGTNRRRGVPGRMHIGV